MEEMRIILREIDPEYAVEENAYTQAIQVIREQMSPERLPEAMELIASQENTTASNLLFLLWNGLNMNLACFHQPVCKRFLQLDYEEIHREETMQSMPDAQRYWEKANAFYHSLTSQQYELFAPITSYYAYIQTSAYKLAHYFGFLVGDTLLPKVEPGYAPDHALSCTYGMELRKYLKVDTQKLIA